MRYIINPTNFYILLFTLFSMARKKKEKPDVSILDPKATLEETVACSRLGRTIASFGATLTGREKRYAELLYHLLLAEREFPERLPVTTQISKEKKPKKTSPTNAINWFAKRYPKEAEPLLVKLEERYNETETSIVYGVRQGRDLSDEHYVKVLANVLQIPMQDAAVMYHGVIKPQIQRMEEEEGLIKVVIK